MICVACAFFSLFVYLFIYIYSSNTVWFVNISIRFSSLSSLSFPFLFFPSPAFFPTLFSLTLSEVGYFSFFLSSSLSFFLSSSLPCLILAETEGNRDGIGCAVKKEKKEKKRKRKDGTEKIRE